MIGFAGISATISIMMNVTGESTSAAAATAISAGWMGTDGSEAGCRQWDDALQGKKNKEL